jgi:hypothetical protein
MYQKILYVVCLCSLILFVNTNYAAANSNSKKSADKQVKDEKANKPVKENKKEWQDTFQVDKKNLTNVGENKYFILIPGYCLNYKDGDNTLTITVLNETKLVDGVETRIVEERETTKGQPTEISRNYYAIDKTNNAVYYFGEDVDEYKDGKVTSHEGSWESGKQGGRFGLMIPSKPKPGQKYHQEVVPDIAMDRAEIVSVTETVKVPAGTYKNCVKTKDGSALEKGTGTKQYAPGIGLIRDDSFVLVKIEQPKKNDTKKEKPAEKKK